MSEGIVLGVPGGKQPKMRSVPSVGATVGADHIYEIPAKLIKTPSDMKIWEKSEAFYEYLGFILAINEAIKGKSNSQGSAKPSESVSAMIGVLDKLDALIDETPPIEQPQRFGNVAFRSWFRKMRDDTLDLLQDVCTGVYNKSIPEIVSYLADSFGNATRIDYGTGHEISFVMFLCSLFKVGAFKDSDKVATGCCIFPRYLDLARKLQKTYRMEPAGSHGVWSLDDYQFVPFIWGSSQLMGHPTVEPHMFLKPDVLKEFGEDYMFLTCIQFINSVKTGPFAEHSNQLWSISGVSSWLKINGGLIKMYKAEVLSKFPVVQHMVFGSLFTLKPVEKCPGMMTPKYPMGPPAAISAASSIGSTLGSSKVSLASEEAKLSSASSGSVTSPVRETLGSPRGSARAGPKKSSVDTEDGSDEKTPSRSLSGNVEDEDRGSTYSEDRGSRRMRESVGQTDSIEAVPEEIDQKEEEDKLGDTISSQPSDAATESVRFSTVEIDDEHHGRKTLSIKASSEVGERHSK